MEVARRAQASAHGRRLFVSGVASEVKKTDLQREFGEFGHVTDIELPLTAKGVAFVEFDNARDAADALEEVTGRKLKGMVLKVKMADIQKTNTGPVAAALAQDRLAGMTRVENDARPLRGRGAAPVTPTTSVQDGARPRSRRSRSASRQRRRGGAQARSGSAGGGQRDGRARSRSRSRARRRSRSRGGDAKAAGRRSRSRRGAPAKGGAGSRARAGSASAGRSASASASGGGDRSRSGARTRGRGRSGSGSGGGGRKSSQSSR